MTVEGIQAERWKALEDHILRWYYHPDLGALRIALAAAQAHLYKKDKAVWLFIMGEPGTGKTDLVIDILSTYEKLTSVNGTKVHQLRELSDKVLLSGFAKKGKANPKASLLNRLGPSIIFLMPDFTHFMDLRPDAQRQIMGNLRDVWDGKLTKEVGNLEEPLVWEGKATVIAACTPAIERKWTQSNELGNRFMAVRWNSGPSPKTHALAAVAHMDHHEEIRAGLRKLAGEFIVGAKMAKPASQGQLEQLAALAQLVAQTRRTVERVNGHGDIIATSGAEAPTRIMMAIAQVARAHAGLFGREEVGEEDLVVARRLALDTIPQRRRVLMDAVDPKESWTAEAEMREMTGEPMSAVNYGIAELAALGIFEKGMDGTGVRFTKSFQKLREEAGLA